MTLGLPSTGGSAPHQGRLLPNQGLFAVPNAIQRVYEYDLYSSASYGAGSNMAGQATTRLFSYALGAAGPGFAGNSTISETNMPVGALAPGGETYEVTAIALEIFGNANIAPLIADVRSIMRFGVLYWEFGQTLVLPIAPIPMIGAGGGIFGMTADTGTPVTQPNNGNGGLWMYSNVVVSIPSTQSFAVQVQYGTGGQAAGVATALTAITQIRCSLFNQARVAVPIA